MAERRKARFRRILKVTLIISAVGAVAYLLWHLRVFTGKPKVNINYLEMYNAMSKPDGFTEEGNAADLYNAAFASFNVISNESRRKLTGDYQPQWPGDLDPESHEILIEWLKSNEEAIVCATKAANKPFYWIPWSAAGNSVMNVTLTHLNDFKHLSWALTFQALIDAEQGRLTEAFERLRYDYLMAKHLCVRKSLIEQFVSCSIKYDVFHCTKVILENAEVPHKELACFQKFLEIEANELTPLSFESERILTLDLLQRFFTENPWGNGHLIAIDFCDCFYPKHPPGTRKLMSTWKGPFRWDFWKQIGRGSGRSHLFWKCMGHDDRRTTLRKIDELYSCIEEMAVKTPWQMHSEVLSYDERTQAIVDLRDDIFLATLFPPAGSAMQRYYERSSDHLATITILALARYEQDKGQYPDKLSDLIDTGYMKDLPMDPFSNSPFVYRKTQDGFTLYSLGSNFEDDGGLYRNDSDKEDYDDVFWPLWKPKPPEPAEQGIGAGDEYNL